MDFQVNALPNVGTTAQVYKGKITFTKKFLWIANVTVNLTNKSFNSPSGILPYDYYPGGSYLIDLDFANTSASSAFGSFAISSFLQPSFGFIPEPSALDIGKGNTTLDNNDYLKKYSTSAPLVAPKDSPFANYTTSFTPNSNLNEEHISFNQRNGNWLASELNFISNGGSTPIFDCYCTGNAVSQISGANFLCGPGVFSVPSGATSYTWTITEGDYLVTLSGAGTNEVTLTPVYNVTEGYFTLSLNYGSSECGFTTITKRIKTENSLTIQGDFEYNECYDNEFRIGVIFDKPIISLSNFVNQTISGQDHLIRYEFNDVSTKVFIYFPKTMLGTTYSFEATYMDSCGVIKNQLMNYYTGDIDCAPLYSSVYPNPVTDILNISLTSAFQGTVGVYDLYGNGSTYLNFYGTHTSINLGGLEPGVYIVRVNIDNITESHTIIKN
jgi:hypothetical protein